VFLLHTENMLDIKIQGADTKLLTQLDKTTTETYQLLCEVYEEDTQLREHFLNGMSFLKGEEVEDANELPNISENLCIWKN
jgi:hypothetical protein